jgi:F-type H+-transporting ATPase subunit a
MEEQLSAVTHWFNHVFVPTALRFLHALHIQPKDFERPIPEYVVMSLVVLVLCTILALILRWRLSVERPGAMQQVAELLLSNPMGFGIKDLLEENVGHEAHRFIAFTGSVSIFILFSNLLSLFPAFHSPTAVAIVPLACAIVTFLYFNYQGFRHHGIGGYLMTFAGSPHDVSGWILAVLLFPVEIISTTARILSLTVRLWANIFASDIIYGLFLGLFAGAFTSGWTKSPILGVVVGVLPALFPILFILLHVFVSVVQAYVFTILPAVYIGMATADEH